MNVKVFLALARELMRKGPRSLSSTFRWPLLPWLLWQQPRPGDGRLEPQACYESLFDVSSTLPLPLNTHFESQSESEDHRHSCVAMPHKTEKTCSIRVVWEKQVWLSLTPGMLHHGIRIAQPKSHHASKMEKRNKQTKQPLKCQKIGSFFVATESLMFPSITEVHFLFPIWAVERVLCRCLHWSLGSSVATAD